METGLQRLIHSSPFFAVKAFRHYPKLFLSAALRIGKLPDGLEREVLSRFRSHPLLTQRLGSLSHENLVSFFQQYPEFINPVPRQFRKYCLVPGALSRKRTLKYRASIYKEANIARLQLLDRLIQDAIRPRIRVAVDTMERNMLHAGHMLSGFGKNKRMAKRWLAAYVSGNEFIRKHPLTLQWIAKHQRLNLALWLRGLRMFSQTEKYGAISLAIEQNPLEAWKLGTYAQSCLAAGGINQRYAAAVVLDMNKRVLYARDRKNRVIARQLLAYSEEGQLVCFDVYPRSIEKEKEIQELFAAYDYRFAEKLQIPVYQDGPYTIANILSHEWYDDGPWAPQKPQSLQSCFLTSSASRRHVANTTSSKTKSSHTRK